MRKWLSGGVSPCQGEGRGFESRLVLTAYNMLLTTPAKMSPGSRLPSTTQTDLAALDDLSHLEQEMFVLDQTSIALAMYDFEDIQM